MPLSPAIAAALLSLSPSAPLQSPTPPIASKLPISRAVGTKLITGFRSARFRMTPEEVRRAIATDFPGLAIAERSEPIEGTTILQLTVPTLAPGPGPAVVDYVFGATSHRLALVTVNWATTRETTDQERQAIAVAGLKLVGFFGSSAQPVLVLAPKVLRPGVVSLYGALDADGAGIELTTTGIPYTSKGVVDAPSSGAASLRLSYMANPANPDVRAEPQTQSVISVR